MFLFALRNEKTVIRLLVTKLFRNFAPQKMKDERKMKNEK